MLSNMGKATERWFKVTLFILLLIIAAGCEKKEKDAGDAITGTEGLAISFVDNFPQDKYILSQGETQDFTVVMDIRNKGTTPLDSDLEHLLHESFKQYLILTKYASNPTYIDGTLKTIWNSWTEEEKRANGGTFENYLVIGHPEFAQFKKTLGKLFIGGFDDGIITMKDRNLDEKVDFSDKTESLLNKFLPGVSSLNPNGGFDSVEFASTINADSLQIDNYNPTILATACYPYATKAGPSVCIDPNPFDTKQKKVCSIGSQILSSQGAPVAVTKIDQEASSKKIRIKITLKNAGKGDVISPASLQKCSSTTDLLKRDDFDMVKLTSVKAGTLELLSSCGPFTNQGTNLIRLFDGEGFVICTIDVSDASKLGSTSAYLTPLTIELNYGYRITASKKISIRKVG